ncbi:MAG: 4-amino-4-deoxy-L-arabinose transferase, partial [Planctomycetaceae bacterium]
AVLAACLPGILLGRKLAVAVAAMISGVVALGTFVALNPFLTAQPRRPLPPGLQSLADRSIVGRAQWLVAHRTSVSRGQTALFSDYALRTPADKLAAVAVQGFGRFGPLGPSHSNSRVRFEWRQDRGGLLWGPCVVAGASWALVRGLRQRARGEPPTSWAVLVAASVAALIVTAYLPLAWDRYFLSLQPGSALLAAGAAVAAFDHLAGARAKDRGRA